MPHNPSEVPTQNLNARSSDAVAEQATIAPERPLWFTRTRNDPAGIDPKATVSYIVARAGRDLPTVDLAPELSTRLRDDFAPERCFRIAIAWSASWAAAAWGSSIWGATSGSTAPSRSR